MSKKSERKLAKRNKRQFKLIETLRRDNAVLNDEANMWQTMANELSQQSRHWQQIHDLNEKHLTNIANLVQERDDLQQQIAHWDAQEAQYLAEINHLNERLQTIDADALKWARQEELVKQAETIGRVAGSRMDALEIFFTQLIGGRYDQHGMLPVPADAYDTPDIGLPDDPRWLEA